MGSRTRAHSSSRLTGSPPGRVDSPPMSRMSAPSSAICRACACAANRVSCAPPSEKESGVTFKMPMISGVGAASRSSSRSRTAIRASLSINASFPLGSVNASAGQEQRFRCHYPPRLPDFTEAFQRPQSPESDRVARCIHSTCRHPAMKVPTKVRSAKRIVVSSWHSRRMDGASRALGVISFHPTH